MSKKYQVIYADPPWSFGDRLRSNKKKDNGKLDYRELERHYDTMSLKDIKMLPVDSIASTDCVLFMWTTDAHLSDAIDVIKSWGFAYKTIAFVWNKKTNKGNQVCFMGKWTMKGSEICLLATKGKAHRLIKKHNVRQLVEAERVGHSVKPEVVRERIVLLLGELPRVELFARKKTAGWDVWGNEVDSTPGVDLVI